GVATDGTSRFNTIATGIAGNATTFSWAVPFNLRTLKGRVLVTAKDSGDKVLEGDESDGYFKVNSKPVASATAPAFVVPGTTVTLDGSGTVDGDVDPLTYSWVQTSGPAVGFNASAVKPTFTAPSTRGAVLGFTLTVSDGLESDTASVTVTVAK